MSPTFPSQRSRCSKQWRSDLHKKRRFGKIPSPPPHNTDALVKVINGKLQGFVGFDNGPVVVISVNSELYQKFLKSLEGVSFSSDASDDHLGLSFLHFSKMYAFGEVKRGKLSPKVLDGFQGFVRVFSVKDPLYSEKFKEFFFEEKDK